MDLKHLAALLSIISSPFYKSNIGAVPGTVFYLFCYFTYDTVHTFLGMFSCWVFFLPALWYVTPASGQIISFLLGRGWGAGRESNPGLPYSSPAR